MERSTSTYAHVDRRKATGGRGVTKELFVENRASGQLKRLMLALMLEGCVNHPNDMVASKLGTEDLEEHAMHHMEDAEHALADRRREVNEMIEFALARK